MLTELQGAPWKPLPFRRGFKISTHIIEKEEDLVRKRDERTYVFSDEVMEEVKVLDIPSIVVRIFNVVREDMVKFDMVERWSGYNLIERQ